MSEIPAKATESEDPSDGARRSAAGDAAAHTTRATTGGPGPSSSGGLSSRDRSTRDTGLGDEPTADAMWQSSPPGSIYDYIKVASFSIGPDGLVDQWSLRAEQLFGIPARRALGMDPIKAFVDPDLREHGQRKMAEILDGREWTGVVPFRTPGTAGEGDEKEGLAEVYVMPTRTEEGEKAAVCIVVDVRTLRSIETDLAASQSIFGQSPFGFLLIDPDLRIRRANQQFAQTFGGAYGSSPEDHRGRGVHDYLRSPEAERVAATLRRVLETGDSITDMHVTGFLPGSEERRHWSVNLYRVHSGSGRPIGIAWLGIDITSRRAAAREAAAARRNLALLNEAGARIGDRKSVV